MPCKGLMIILDGLGDRSCPELDGATPLEAAATPNLDRLLKSGMGGMIDPLTPGVPVSTHTGTGLLMGLAQRDAVHLTRGPVEAAGIGLLIQPGDVALRCNFATLEEDAGMLKILDRRAGRIQKGTKELAAALQTIPMGHGVTATLRPATQHRAVLRLSGPGLSPAITDTDPGSNDDPRVLPCQPLNLQDAAAARTAEIINGFVREAYDRLKQHRVNQKREDKGLLPANGIITRGAGALREAGNIIQHLGISAAVVAGERTVLGLAQLLNYTAFTDSGFTSLADTDLAAKVEMTKRALETHEMVFLHVKAPDICAHDRDPKTKRSFLERFDSKVAPLLQGDWVIGVTGDHSTDCNSGRHCGDPVPSILHAPKGRRDGCTEFSELGCMVGGLGRITGSAFLFSLLDAMGCMHNFRRDDRAFFTSGKA